ncbi:MAG TPA: phosphatase PAP2 family protein [Flavipsychrobacter sp.]|nr:phosphatase PAP2 family protein [Flavipsychrobacter sp.]
MEKIVPLATIKITVAFLLVLVLSANSCLAQNKNIEWLRDITKGRTAAGSNIMNDVTNTTYPVSAAVPIGQLIYGYATRKKQTVIYGWETVAGLGITGVITFGLKYTVNEKRPYITYPDIKPYSYDTDPSFPSGHTSVAFSTATSLSLEYPKWYIIAPSFLWAGVVGYSRLYLGMHYPGDVLVGAIVGAGSSWLSYKGTHWLHQHSLKKKLYSSE